MGASKWVGSELGPGAGGGAGAGAAAEAEAWAEAEAAARTGIACSCWFIFFVCSTTFVSHFFLLIWNFFIRNFISNPFGN